MELLNGVLVPIWSFSQTMTVGLKPAAMPEGVGIYSRRSAFGMFNSLAFELRLGGLERRLEATATPPLPRKMSSPPPFCGTRARLKRREAGRGSHR